MRKTGPGEARAGEVMYGSESGDESIDEVRLVGKAELELELTAEQAEEVIHKLSAANARLTTALAAAEAKVRRLQRAVLTVEVQQSKFCNGSCAAARKAKSEASTRVVAATARAANAAVDADEDRKLAWRAAARAKRAHADALAANRGRTALLRDMEEMRRDLEAYRVLNRQIIARHGEDVLLGVMAENALVKENEAKLERRIEKLSKEMAQIKLLRNKAVKTANPSLTQNMIDDAAAAPKLREQLKAVQLRMAKLERINARLRVELSAFDPEFFQQLQDLKTTHESALALLHDYRHWLLLVSRRHGIQFPKHLHQPLPGFTLSTVSDRQPTKRPPRTVLRA